MLTFLLHQPNLNELRNAPGRSALLLAKGLPPPAGPTPQGASSSNNPSSPPDTTSSDNNRIISTARNGGTTGNSSTAVVVPLKGSVSTGHLPFRSVTEEDPWERKHRMERAVRRRHAGIRAKGLAVNGHGRD